MPPLTEFSSQNKKKKTKNNVHKKAKTLPSSKTTTVIVLQIAPSFPADLHSTTILGGSSH
jgi:hypothetical protein